MIDFDTALALILNEARPLPCETVALDAAGERVLATDLKARGDAPRTAVSAMDGYAVRDVDLATLPARLPVATVAFAGRADVPVLPAGACVRVFTGGPTPPGADRVVVQEIVSRDGDAALFEAPPGPGRHIRAAGSDFRAGDTLLAAGTVLGFRAMVAAAAADVAELSVVRRPRIVILGTGDELAEPGQALETAGGIPESVSFGVAALARQCGAQVLARRRLSDTPELLEAAARRALGEADLVVVTGGASVGEKDYARSMFAPFGLELIFSKAAIKPGKPVWFGRAGGALILGLPGNPTSALVTARLFLAPLVAGLAGRDPAALLTWRDAVLAAPLKPCGDRETFERGRRVDGGVAGLDVQDSATQKALASADVLIRRRPGAPGLSVGEVAAVLDF
ncbi:MAG: molybdopterin molybdotransferase MoeA [Alphaproteobacteria bacterium]|uniref:molybdopterin molybdotransferase MoeA n=1 Tax=Brevundimonas sp. TaxID=1871086 RepID=UPI00121C7573|nr:molybdopterin molybdotransferase MoeA [Brevundimonas sp.]MBU3971557.1 molybdopterin molybdotransferase MoeA [Alphaproteobacteria bacterium]MBA3048324.1 molybdopterin molybdotransferase MoeA [Brevundimonas sp.]MBU3974929.1 molybdopterin molybdotransferase MoeA [Alphaproteobacteria bacterium]MBU4039912.1 molybdopterin molybdotransferase MoeA [Alphaproteobacteria bacterium]MBU4137375.1 molybdopterin molybdotransferase MoeA [Alphaproteobacteria bacterium]